VQEIASQARGDDETGRRSEFLQLVKTAADLSGEKLGLMPPLWQPANRSFAQPALGGRSYVASTWLGLVVGVIAGTVLVLTIATTAFFVARVTVRTISFACSAPAK
jgi:hypothetical protein